MKIFNFQVKLDQKESSNDFVGKPTDEIVIAKNYCNFNCNVRKVANYPSSPSRKLCELGVAQSSGLRGVVAKALNSPPGEYGRKAET